VPGETVVFAPDSSVHQGFCPGVPMFVLSQPLVKRLWTLLATTSQNSVARRPEGSIKMVVVCSCEINMLLPILPYIDVY
jgi:hypothetical protein